LNDRIFVLLMTVRKMKIKAISQLRVASGPGTTLIGWRAGEHLHPFVILFAAAAISVVAEMVGIGATSAGGGFSLADAYSTGQHLFADG